MQSTIVVHEPMSGIELITLMELKAELGITDALSDAKLDLLINRVSGEIATMCNRVFAKRKVTETFRYLDNQNSLFLSCYPVQEIISCSENGTLTEAYDLEAEKGRLTRLSTAYWGGPASVTYIGGYDLPMDAPPALRSAAMIGARKAYYQAIRGDSSISTIRHKEASITYSNTTTTTGSLGGGGAITGDRAINDLLYHYVRFWI